MNSEDADLPLGTRSLLNVEDLGDDGRVACPLCNQVGELGGMVRLPEPLEELAGLIICRRCFAVLEARRRGVSEAEVEKERQRESEERQAFIDSRMRGYLLSRGKEDFDSLEEANAALQEVAQEWNRTPRAELGGLSPAQIVAGAQAPERRPNASDTLRRVRDALQDPAAAAVADRLLAQMDEYSEEELATALTIWRDFTRKRRINRRAETSWAAGVEYTVCRLALDRGATQAVIGEKYGVSGGTVGARFAEIRDTLRIKLFDRRYMLAVGTWIQEGAFLRSRGLPLPDWSL